MSQNNFQQIIVKQYDYTDNLHLKILNPAESVITIGFKRQNVLGEFEGSWIAIPKSEVSNLIKELEKYKSL